MIHADEESADDNEVKGVLQDVEQLFRQRSFSNPHLIDTIIGKLSQAENKADDSNLNFDVYIFESKVLYWKAKYLLNALDTKSEAGHSCFILGKEKADAAIQVNDGYAEGYYYSALHLGALPPYIEVSGVSDAKNKALQAADDAMKGMDDAINRVTRSIVNGETLDGWGPHREKGRIRSKIPDIFDSLAPWRAAEYDLKKAYDGARNYAGNVVGYVECLRYCGNYNSFMASLILDVMLKKDPNTYNPDRIEETRLEFEKAIQLKADVDHTIAYTSSKKALEDFAEATKLDQEAAIRVANSQTRLDDLNKEQLNWLENQNKQEKVFSTFGLLRSKIEDAAPVLIMKIQAYLASQQDTLQTILEDLQKQLKDSRDPKTRDSLEFDIVVLSDLAVAKQHLGNQEELKKAIDTAVHGSGEERAKALSLFDPLTQICLKWVFQVTPPTSDNIFMEMKKEITDLEAFSAEHLSTIESQIQIAKQDLSAAHDDESIAKILATKIFEASPDEAKFKMDPGLIDIVKKRGGGGHP
jgi:hypothetical protein